MKTLLQNRNRWYLDAKSGQRGLDTCHLVNLLNHNVLHIFQLGPAIFINGFRFAQGGAVLAQNHEKVDMGGN